MKESYRFFLKEVEPGFIIYVPDWEIYTEGDDIKDALLMARDEIGLMGIDYEDDGISFPTIKEHELTDEYDFEEFVEVDFDEYRKNLPRILAEKNCRIPKWVMEDFDMGEF